MIFIQDLLDIYFSFNIPFHDDFIANGRTDQIDECSFSELDKLCSYSFVYSTNTYWYFYFQLGMRNYHMRKNHKFAPTVNLDTLWSLVSEQTRLQYKDSDKAPVIDCVRAVSRDN